MSSKKVWCSGLGSNSADRFQSTTEACGSLESSLHKVWSRFARDFSNTKHWKHVQYSLSFFAFAERHPNLGWCSCGLPYQDDLRFFGSTAKRPPYCIFQWWASGTIVSISRGPGGPLAQWSLFRVGRVDLLHNRPFARWILQFFVLSCKLGLSLFKPHWDYKI